MTGRTSTAAPAVPVPPAAVRGGWAGGRRPDRSMPRSSTTPIRPAMVDPPAGLPPGPITVGTLPGVSCRPPGVCGLPSSRCTADARAVRCTPDAGAVR